jgi:GNAT superfamily N-acetyltransferase
MRYYEIFETASSTIEPISYPNDEDDILEIMVSVFSAHMSEDALIGYLNHATDWNLSKKLVYNGKIIGCYLFGEGDIEQLVSNCKHIDLSPFEGLHGIEGIAVAVLPEYRGTGLGNKLKDLPKHMGYDYVYGQQLKSLNNLEDWLKRRFLVADCGGVWVTAEIFK